MGLDRRSGILLHPTSLPSRYPIGDLGEYAYAFIDILSEAGFSLWQILPLNPVNYANSPYMSSSSLAFNTLLMDPDSLLQEGLIDEVPHFKAKEIPNYVDFETAKALKNDIVITAYNRFNKNSSDFKAFCRKYGYLQEIAIFDLLSAKYNAEWSEWPLEYSPDNIKKLKKDYHHEIGIFMFGQYIMQRQWLKLKEYAFKKGISIIGDIPIYVDYNSYDVWANRDIFNLSSRTCRPKEVSGVPPDYFSEDGQLWNNPLYKWFYRGKINEDLISWWTMRIKRLKEFVDIIRIDHFRGFEKYWAVKYGEKTARKGRWRKGPGALFFDKLFEKLGRLDIIAEDLGIITEKVTKLRELYNFPGMKILQFAFSDPKNPYLPSNYKNTNYVVFTGTHDNNTTLGWYINDTDLHTRHFINQYMQREIREGDIVHSLICTALSSTAKWAVIPMQDILNMDDRHRMNKPSTAEGNWAWKMEISDLDLIDRAKYYKLNSLYNRIFSSQSKVEYMTHDS